MTLDHVKEHVNQTYIDILNFINTFLINASPDVESNHRTVTNEIINYTKKVF